MAPGAIHVSVAELIESSDVPPAPSILPEALYRSRDVVQLPTLQ